MVKSSVILGSILGIVASSLSVMGPVLAAAEIIKPRPSLKMPGTAENTMTGFASASWTH
jgi:hypothetical protein